MSARDDIIAGLREIRSELAPEADGAEPAFFIWKGAEVPCVPSMIGRTAIPVPGGHEIMVTGFLLVVFDEFLTADSTLTTVDGELWTTDSNKPHPVAGRTLTYRGKQYRIATANRDAMSAYYKLDLADRHSGR